CYGREHLTSTDDNVKETNPEKTVDMLADYYEKHFAAPK
ncbi:unnamed protein product, partial [Rotaria socialis]